MTSLRAAELENKQYKHWARGVGNDAQNSKIFFA
jgi:hypothetical protein